MSAVSIGRMTLVPLGCELMMTYTNTDLRVGQSLATRECTDAFMWVQTGAALSLVIRVDNRHRHLHLLQHRRRRRHLLQLQHQVPLPLPLPLPLQRRRRRPISLCQQTQRRSLLIVVLTLPVISRSSGVEASLLTSPSARVGCRAVLPPASIRRPLPVTAAC